MRTVLLASLRTHTRRYVAAAVAVVIGVAFVVVTDALASATRNGLLAGLDAAVPRRRRRGLRRRPGRTPPGWSTAPRSVATTPRRSAGPIQPVREGDRLVDERADVGALAPDADAALAGRCARGGSPSGPDEALADVNAAKADRIEVGDRLRVGTGHPGRRRSPSSGSPTRRRRCCRGRSLPALADARALVVELLRRQRLVRRRRRRPAT